MMYSTAETVREHSVRLKAYEIWLNRGCPHGTAEQDWHEAERRLAAEAASSLVAGTAATADESVGGQAQFTRDASQSPVRQASGLDAVRVARLEPSQSGQEAEALSGAEGRPSGGSSRSRKRANNNKANESSAVASPAAGRSRRGRVSSGRTGTRRR